MILRRCLVAVALLATTLVAAGTADAAADSVRVVVNPRGTLVITGDNTVNDIVLCQDPENREDFAVIILNEPPGDFTVKYAPGVTGDVLINMRGGGDQLRINGFSAPPGDCDDVYPPQPDEGVGAGDVNCLDDHCHHHAPEMLFPRDLRINMGPQFEATVIGYDFGVVDDMTIINARDVNLDYVNVWDRATVLSNPRDSSIRIDDSYFGRLSIRTRNGEDFVGITNTDMGDRPFISTAAKDDRVRLSGSTNATGRATINTGSGKDVFSSFNRPEERTFLFNLIMGAHDDRADVITPLGVGDRLNGGSGNMDVLGTPAEVNPLAVGGPTINGFELFEELEL